MNTDSATRPGSNKKHFQIMIHDQNYGTWSFYEPNNTVELKKDDYPELANISPIESKLMTKDVFTVDDSGKIDIVHSISRTTTAFSGVLLVENNKTFGRTSNNKRLLYKCIPDDKHLPAFLLPYDIKIAFSKIYKNKYIVFKFDHWLNKHPQGVIVETIGDVDNLEAFYEYQLYCKSLHISITDMTNRTRAILNQKTSDEYIEQILHNPLFAIEDRRSEYVFTIDPQNSMDFDDGFSIRECAEGYKITVYIANVYFWLEIMGLWNSFSKRVATIYLPDRRRPMLPTILSDTLCSLQKGQSRFAFCMEMIIGKDESIGEPVYKNAIISVSKNYVYEDPRMLAKDTHYKMLLEATEKIDSTVKNSHDLVAFWMIQMNKNCAEYMIAHKTGIFRTASIHNTALHSAVDLNHVGEDTQRLIQLWNNSAGNYVPFSDDSEQMVHAIMNSKSYIHITSPIRRLVDLLNQMTMMVKLGTVSRLSNDAAEFLGKWMSELEYINTATRSIRKIQTECDVLTRCFQTPDIMDILHEGVVFDKLNKNDGVFAYMVYLEKLRLLAKITTDQDLANYSKHTFRIYLFQDEYNAKKKIRLQLDLKFSD